MNNTKFILKRGATGARIEFTLSTEDGDFNLTDYQVFFTAKKKNALTAAINNQLCVTDADQTANTGKGYFDFDNTTAAIPKGEYRIELTAVHASGAKLIFPTNAKTPFGTLTVIESLG